MRRGYSNAPGTALDIAQEVPVHARLVGMLESLGEALEQRVAFLLGMGARGELSRSGDCEVTYLPGARQPRRQVRRGRPQRARQLGVLGDLNASMPGRHSVSVPPVYHRALHRRGSR